MTSNGRFLELLDDYVADETSSAERGALLNMVRSGEYQELLEQHITTTFNASDIEGPVLSTRQKEEILQNIFAEARPAAPVIVMAQRKRSTWQWAAAAAIFVAVGAGIFWPHHSTNQGAMATRGDNVSSNNTVVPGGYKAMLTLGDGSVVALDKAKGNALPAQGNVRVSNNGQELVYTGTQDNNHIVYNKVSTPRGGQYRIVLPDGSKVWLNAASTLRFPIAFAGEERHVLLTGEAYFEVNSHPVVNNRQQKIPFTVSMNGGAKVTVLGTHFNVMAYNDESAMKTTLLEGAVKIEQGQAGSLLKPGEQAVLGNNEIKVVKANTQAATAWKEGFFDFNGADIPAVMRQIARWYDLDVVYEKAVHPAKDFGGKISRDGTIADLVTILETNGIHVRLEAKSRKIVVLD